MKSLSLLTLTLLTSATLTATVANAKTVANMEGSYTSEKSIALFLYDSQEACAADSGTWNDGVCILQSEDEVKIDKNKDGSYQLVIETIGNNAHTCLFNEKAVRNEDTLTARLQTQVFRSMANGKRGLVKETCVVKAIFRDTNELSIRTNGKCDFECGAGVVLDIESAIRK